MTTKHKPLVKTRLLYWPIDVAVKRLVDLDLRSQDKAPAFFAEFAKVSSQAAKGIYANARDGFLADLIASPKGERLTKANAVIHMAALRRTVQGLDSAFFTSLGLTKFEGDKFSYDAGMAVLQQVGPIESVAGNETYGFIYDFQDQQLKPMSLRGMNALIGDPAIADPSQELRPGRDFGSSVDAASARYDVDSAAKADCEGTAKKIGHWVGAGVGGFVGGVVGGTVGESIGGTVGWIAGGPFGAAPGAGAGEIIGGVIGSTVGGEYGTDAGEAAGTWLGGVICGGGSDPQQPSQPRDVTGDDGSDPASPGAAPGPAPETGAGNSPSPSPSSAPSEGPSPAPSPGGSASPPPPPAEPGDGGDGGNDGDDDDESMINPNWDDGTGHGGGEGEHDPSLEPKFGPRVVVARWFNPAITDPVNPIYDRDGRTVAFDMARLPQAVKLDRGYALSLNGFASAFRALAKDVSAIGGLTRPGIPGLVSKNGLGNLGGLENAQTGALSSLGAGLSVGRERLFKASVSKAQDTSLNPQESLRLIGEGVARHLLRD